MGGRWAVALILDAEKLGINGGFGFLGLTGEAPHRSGRVKWRWRKEWKSR